MKEEREQFLKKIDARKKNNNGNKEGKKETINGVTIVHRKGIKTYTYTATGKSIEQEGEFLEMFDENGNLFYTNCKTKAEAEKLITKLLTEGKTAVIGPKAPVMLKGKLIKNLMPGVGVYIKKPKIKEKANEPEEEKGDEEK